MSTFHIVNSMHVHMQQKEFVNDTGHRKILSFDRVELIINVCNIYFYFRLELLLDEREKQREEEERLLEEEAIKLLEEEAAKQAELEELKRLAEQEQERLEEQLHQERLEEQRRLLEQVRLQEEEEERQRQAEIELRNRLEQEKQIIAATTKDKEEEPSLWEKRESRDSHLSGLEEAHSSMSDEGILTTDELDEDFERRRTTTMESEE